MPDLNPADFNAIDWILLVAIFVSGLIGLFLGLVREVVTLLVWVAAIVATIYLGPQVLPYVTELVQAEIVANLVAYGLTFVVALIIAWMLGFAINSALHGKNDDVGMGLGPINKLFGFVYGLVRGVVIICVFYFIGLTLAEEVAEIDPVMEAQTLPVYHEITRTLYRAVPENLRTDEMRRLGGKLEMTFQEAFSPAPATTPGGTMAPDGMATDAMTPNGAAPLGSQSETLQPETDGTMVPDGAAGENMPAPADAAPAAGTTPSGGQ